MFMSERETLNVKMFFFFKIEFAWLGEWVCGKGQTERENVKQAPHRAQAQCRIDFMILRS